MSVRVRFAPSPTGHLHVGNARTALLNWLFARHCGGSFVLRIEDTDLERQQGGAEEAIFEDLAWMGLDWDEGPVPCGWRAGGFASRAADRGEGVAAQPAPPNAPGDTATGAAAAGGRAQGSSAQDRSARGGSAPATAGVGSRGPYRQSERGLIYEEAYARLRAKGLVYPCFCASETLEADRQAALASGRTPGYPGRCAALPESEVSRRLAAGEGHALRFRVGHFGVVHDLVRGEVDFRSRPVFDPVIRRRDGRPTYNFAVVVDDAAMEITHVLRGEDHLTNTALQLRLYEELDLRPPLFGHLSLILGPDGSPLSKRHGATSVGEMRDRGYPPEGLVNSLALLGWTPPGDRVLLETREMIELFELAQVNATPAIFDVAKLDWISGQKIRAMDEQRRGLEIGRALRAAGLLAKPEDEVRGWLARLGSLLATGINRFEEAPAAARFMLEFDPARAVAAGALEGETSRRVLQTFAGLLEASGGSTEGSVPALIEKAKAATGLKGRALLHPLRAALTGEDSGPELARILPLIEEAARLQVRPGLAGPLDRLRSVLERA